MFVQKPQNFLIGMLMDLLWPLLDYLFIISYKNSYKWSLNFELTRSSTHVSTIILISAVDSLHSWAWTTFFHHIMGSYGYVFSLFVVLFYHNTYLLLHRWLPRIWFPSPIFFWAWGQLHFSLLTSLWCNLSLW